MTIVEMLRIALMSLVPNSLTISCKRRVQLNGDFNLLYCVAVPATVEFA